MEKLQGIVCDGCRNFRSYTEEYITVKVKERKLHYCCEVCKDKYHTKDEAATTELRRGLADLLVRLEECYTKEMWVEPPSRDLFQQAQYCRKLLEAMAKAEGVSA